MGCKFFGGFNKICLRKPQRGLFFSFFTFYVVRTIFVGNQQKDHRKVLCVNSHQVFVPFEAEGIVMKPDGSPNDWMIYTSLSQNRTLNDQRLFFHETSGRSYLSFRQCCAIESAARHNPNRSVQLFLRPSPYCENGLTKPLNMLPREKLIWLKILSVYHNVAVVLLNEDQYFSGTPLESWYLKGEWRKSPFAIGHLSDYIRMLTLYKGGGMYLDMDVLSLKTFHGAMFQNYFVYENEAMDTIGNSIMHLQWGHELANQLIRLLSEEYDPEAYAYHGPDAISDVMNRVCGLVAGNPKSNKCSDVHVLPHRYFHPVAAMFSHMLFENKPSGIDKELFAEIQKSFGLHLWNSISSKEPVNMNSNQIIAVLAREHCPLTASRVADFLYH